MRPRPFTGSFTQQEAIPAAGIAAALEVLQSGRLHRYNVAPGEVSQTAALEADFAAWQGARHCLACASGGQAMALALRAAGLTPGAPVLTNAFTLAPVPGAIAAAGGRPVLVEITPALTIDLDDLNRKAARHPGAILLLSLMRGHLPDMEALTALAVRYRLTLIEDAAHTMGAAWNGRRSGSFGLAGCFSTQTYKHINSGEGGLLVSDDAAFMARAIIASGSYMLYQRHGAAPPAEAFDRARLEMPNTSARMDDLRAAILRPQLRDLDRNIARWNRRYRALEAGLQAIPGIALCRRPAAESFVGSSIQFRLDIPAAAFVATCAELGVELKWFGAAEPHGFTSAHQSWGYVAPQALPATDRILSTLFDMRIPLTFSPADCTHIASIIAYAAAQFTPASEGTE